MNLFVTDPANTIPAPPPTVDEIESNFEIDLVSEPSPESTDRTATLDLWHPVFDDLDEEVAS